MKDTVFQVILKPINPDLIKKSVSIFNKDYDYDKFKTYEALSVHNFIVNLLSGLIAYALQPKKPRITGINDKLLAEC